MIEIKIQTSIVGKACTLISVGPKGQEKFIERSRANEPQCKTGCDESG